MAEIKELTIDAWHKKYDWYKNIFNADDISKYANKFKCWSVVLIEGKKYLIPGIDKNCMFIYVTRKTVNYNVIVGL